MYTKLKTLLNQFYSDSLYRNSIYLMASTFVMAALGFVFWIAVARFYTSEQIGLATTLLSVTTLITGFSMLGLNNALIRYLPTANNKNNNINTGFTLVVIAATVLTLGFLVGLHILSPDLLFLRQNPLSEALFILFIVFAAVNALVDSIFVAYRSSVYVFIKNSVWSILKLCLPLFVVSLGAWGIYASVSIATVLAAVLSIVILAIKFDYQPGIQVNKDIVASLARYSGGNYVAGILGGLPMLILPIIITNTLGPKMAAYYYMPMMIANLLYIIPQATTRSFFAEGSTDIKNLKLIYLRALKINALLLIPAMMVVYFFGKYVLQIFGHDYAVEGTRLLQLFAVASIFYNINSLGGNVLNIRREVKKLIGLNFVGALTVILGVLLLADLGLYGVGLSWIFAQAVVSVIYWVVLWFL